MSRTKLAVAVVVLLLVAGGAAIALGIGPAPGGSSGEDIDDFPTETTADSTDGADSDGGDDGSATTSSTPPFTFSIDEITECGETCRDVTVTLFNEQDQTAENVTVYTRIYAGNSTAEGDRIWQGKEDIGTMEPSSSATRTQRVSLSYGDAFSVNQNDGWITVVTTVQSDNTTVTFEDQRNVM